MQESLSPNLLKELEKIKKSHLLRAEENLLQISAIKDLETRLEATERELEHKKSKIKHLEKEIIRINKTAIRSLESSAIGTNTQEKMTQSNQAKQKTLLEINLQETKLCSDKWEHCLQQYELELESYRKANKTRLLEVGVRNGGSLQCWSRYLGKDSEVVGIDIDCRASFLEHEGSVKSYVGDATDPSWTKLFCDKEADFDIIIDAGLHVNNEIIETFSLLFEKTKPGGIYIAEGLHSCYQESHHGSLTSDTTIAPAITFFKEIVDNINSEHWVSLYEYNISKVMPVLSEQIERKSHLRALLNSIESIKFTNSMVFIRKRISTTSGLGQRIFARKEAADEPAPLQSSDQRAIHTENANQNQIDSSTIDQLKQYFFNCTFAAKELLRIQNKTFLTDNGLSLKIIKSVAIGNNRYQLINVIEYRANDKFNFLVFQHVSSCDYIYIKDMQAWHFYCHVNPPLANRNLELYTKAEKELDELDSIHSFQGIIFGNFSPYHTFYDGALGLQTAKNYKALDNIPSFFTLKGIKYIDPANFFPELSKSLKTSGNLNDLNNAAKKSHGFYFLVGSFFDTANDNNSNILRGFDASAMEYAQSDYADITKKAEEAEVIIRKNRMNNCLIIWYGLLSTKRTWKEQSECIITIASYLESKSIKSCFVIDGYTSPVDMERDSKTLRKGIEDDLLIMKKIKLNIENNYQDISVVSCIGFTPIEKMRLASYCDYHISNGATGSIYVSRFHQKPGLLHYSNKAIPMNKQHIQYNHVYIPKECIHDIQENSEEAQNMDHVSYSIDPSEVLKIFKKLMTK